MEVQHQVRENKMTEGAAIKGLEAYKQGLKSPSLSGLAKALAKLGLGKVQLSLSDSHV